MLAMTKQRPPASVRDSTTSEDWEQRVDLANRRARGGTNAEGKGRS